MKISLRLLVVIFWAAMMFWLYNRDIKTGEFLNYQDVIDPDNLIRNEWMTVSMQGRTIGVVNSRMDINENSRVHRYVIEDVAELHLNLMGNQQSLDIEVRTLLDVDMTLQAFECWLKHRYIQSGSRDDGTMAMSLTSPQVHVANDVIKESKSRETP